MKQRLLVLSAFFLICVLASSVGLAGDLRPGVLSPDEVDFGGKTVTILVGDLGYTGHNKGFPVDEKIAEAEQLFGFTVIQRLILP